MGFFTRLLNFEQQITFYAAYHHNNMNKFIHMIFVPAIMWSVLVWLTAYFPAYNVEDWLAAGSTWREYAAHVPPIGAAWWVAALYCSYYVLLEPFAGSLFTPVIFTLVYLADRFLLAYGTETACLYALYVHVLSWIMQFVGHGLFEKRAPALLDSLLQALLLAPLFVWIEFLFMCGYRPKLRKRLDEKAVKAIAEWKKASTTKLKRKS